MRNYFRFAGVSCSDFGVWCSGSGTAHTPIRDQSQLEIPGKSGDLLIDNGRWKNVIQEYSCFIYGDFLARFSAFANFVLANRGYQRLEDTYHPDEFRLAFVADSFDPELEATLRNGIFTIQFNCKPQRFLITGETPTTFSADGTITNPTRFLAKPLIKVTGTGEFSVGDSVITVSDNPGTLIIDSELMDIYSGTTNCNSMVSFSDDQFPLLSPGENGVDLDSGITAVEITPRWFIL